jgi:hypothetical protein
MFKETCYDCIHQTVCQTHKVIKNATGSPLHPKKAEWFSDLFGLVKDVCSSFKSTVSTGNGTCTECGKGNLYVHTHTKKLTCLFCGHEYF